MYQDRVYVCGGVEGGIKNGYVCHTPHKTIEHTHVKILVNTLECHKSLGDIDGEVVDR